MILVLGALIVVLVVLVRRRNVELRFVDTELLEASPVALALLVASRSFALRREARKIVTAGV
jgi:hypothetical protein